jgi:uncharacterized protein (DUF58 family)
MTSSASVLSRYIDPELLDRLAAMTIDPGGVVLGDRCGTHRSRRHGFAVEFAGHREYVPGDDPKHIDWRVFFSRDKYVVKQHAIETNLVAHLVLDVSASMRYGSGDSQKLRRASKLAVTLASAIARQGDSISLTTFDERIRRHIPTGHSHAQIAAMIEHVDEVEPTRKTRLADCLLEAAARMRSHEVVFVFSDFLPHPEADLAAEMDALDRVLQRLRFHGHHVVLFQVLHPDELTFPFRGRVRFLDLESTGAFLTSPDDLRRSYLEALDDFLARIGSLCRRNEVQRVPINSAGDLRSLLLNYLDQFKPPRHR